MPFSGSGCDSATRVIVCFRYPGNNIVCNGSGPISSFDAIIAGNPFDVDHVISLGADGTPVDCCPFGMSYDPIAGQCNPTGAPPPPPTPTCPPGQQLDSNGNCVPIPPPPCPDGTSWDPGSETCVPTTTGSGSGGVTGVVIPPLPNQDETGDCCAVTTALLAGILQQLQSMASTQSGGGSSGGSGTPDACCNQVTAAIVGIMNSLNAILNVLGEILSTAEGGAPDLSGVIAALDAISASLAGIPAAAAQIASAISAIPPFDQTQLTRIADDLESTPGLPPDPSAKVKALLDYLVANYGFDPSVAQIIES